MLPSNSSPHPFSYSDKPFDFESNPTSNQETINCDEYFSNLSFFHFPNPPFEDYQFSHDLLLDFQHQTNNLLLPEPEPDPEPQPIVNNMDEEKIMGVSSIKKITKVPRKKRHRHSKINTARGLRDPRMRLSLKVAKRFFRLQDMLGFEKASKTVEWLLNQAKEEINHVAAAAAATKSSVSPSSTSECQGLSSPEEVVRKPPGVKRRTKTHSSRKFIARECREKARERARERTKQKMMRSNQQCELEATTNHKLSQLGSCKSLNPSLDLVTNARELISSTSLSEKHLGTAEATVHDDRFFGYYYYEQKEHHHFFHEFS